MPEQIGVPKSYLKQRLANSQPAFNTFAQATGERYNMITSGNLQKVVDTFQATVLKAIDSFEGETIASLEELATICQAISDIKKETADGIFSNAPGLSKIALSFRQLVDIERAKALEAIKQEYALPEKKAQKNGHNKPKVLAEDSVFSHLETMSQTVEKIVGKISTLLLNWYQDTISKLQQKLSSNDGEYSKSMLTNILSAATAIVDELNTLKQDLEKLAEESTDLTFPALQDKLLRMLESIEQKIKSPAKNRSPQVQAALDEVNTESIALAMMSLDIKQFHKIEGTPILSGDTLEKALAEKFLGEKIAAIKEGNGSRDNIRVGVAEYEYLSKSITNCDVASAEEIPHGRLKRMIEHLNNEFHGGLAVRDAKFIKKYAESIIQEQRESLDSVGTKLDQLSKPSFKAVATVIDAFFALESELAELDIKLNECLEIERKKDEIEGKYRLANQKHEQLKRSVSDEEKKISRLRKTMSEGATNATTAEDFAELAKCSASLSSALANVERLKPELITSSEEVESIQMLLLEADQNDQLPEKAKILKRQAELKAEIQAASDRTLKALETK